jgi:hypothetical protein
LKDGQAVAFVAFTALAVLGGCAGGEQMMQETARSAAKTAVNEIALQRFPGVDVAPFTDCIIDNATDQEVLNIATGALTGPDEATIQIILGVASRPETVQCIGPAALARIPR